MRIGFDLDNTIICYDDAFSHAALERRLLPSDAGAQRKEYVRTYLEAQGPEGVHAWQALQGYVYGVGIGTARLFEDVLSTCALLASSGHELFIVSHKTQFGHFDATRIDLRRAARDFLSSQGITRLIEPHRIFFCPTLQEKVEMVAELRCDIFVDDLVDVLHHARFPKRTRRILFRSTSSTACEHVASWREIAALLSTVAP